jgi:putative hydrolase of the HAD superfamily
MNKPKLILFDFGGVLIDYSNSFQTASKESGIPIEYLDTAFDNNEDDITVGKISPNDIYQLAVKDSGIEADIEYDFVNSWVKDYITIKPAYNLLLELSEDYLIGILSNTYKDIIEQTIKSKKIPNIKYSYIFESCEIGYKKPNKQIFKYVEENTKLRGEEIFFIDDRQDFLDTAEEFKWNTFLFDKNNPEKAVRNLRRIFTY